MDKDKRNQLRRSIRQQRLQLDEHIQQQHAFAMAQRVSRLAMFRNARRVAFYLAEDGEIDPRYLIEKAWQYKKDVFLPILPPTGNSLFFAPYTADTPLAPNRFGIDEPQLHPRHWLRARQLNLIMMPLVAFDPQGNRLGMGGGYYDRSLAFINHRKQWHSPHLIGLAHELQKVKQLPCASWDVPLQMIVTEAQAYGAEK